MQQAKKLVEAERVMPDPHAPLLTERVQGIDQTGAAVEVNVPAERALTLYLNAQEIVTMMTINDYPEYLATLQQLESRAGHGRSIHWTRSGEQKRRPRVGNPVGDHFRTYHVRA